MEQLIIAILDRIENELELQYWNKNQKHLNSPFQNTGETYSNKLFTVRAYNWNEENEDLPNFDSNLLKCWWYKHSHRGLEYRLTFNGKSNENKLEQLSNFLNDCINEIKKDFK